MIGRLQVDGIYKTFLGFVKESYSASISVRQVLVEIAQAQIIPIAAVLRLEFATSNKAP